MSLLILEAQIRRTRRTAQKMVNGDGDSEGVPPCTTIPCSASDIGEYLEQKSMDILDAVNQRNLEAPALDCVSPLYTTSHGTQTLTTTKAHFLQNIQEVTRVNPGYHITFVSSSSEVDKAKGTARVWITHGEVGFHDDGLQRQNVKLFRWERSKGTWWCMGHEGMRGSPLV
jgi:hypothetical protein